MNVNATRKELVKMRRLIKEIPELGADGEVDDYQNEAEIRDTLLTSLYVSIDELLTLVPNDGEVVT